MPKGNYPKRGQRTAKSRKKTSETLKNSYAKGKRYRKMGPRNG